MLTRKQFMAVYEFQEDRRFGGPSQATGNYAAVQKWVQWRSEWWHELRAWLSRIHDYEAAQRGEGGGLTQQEPS